MQGGEFSASFGYTSFGPLAHAWLEQRTHNPLVPGSTPGRPTNQSEQLCHGLPLFHLATWHKFWEVALRSSSRLPLFFTSHYYVFACAMQRVPVRPLMRSTLSLSERFS
jgi:hypothetical protein